MIVTAKLSLTVKEWIKEYITVKRIHHKVTHLMTLNKISYLVYKNNKNKHLSQEELLLFLPNWIQPMDTRCYGFEIRLKDEFIGFVGFNLKMQPESDDIDIKLFLTRLLYFHRDIQLIHD